MQTIETLQHLGVIGALEKFWKRGPLRQKNALDPLKLMNCIIGCYYSQTIESFLMKHFVFKVYALDCEMCSTTIGNELTRVTVIDYSGKTVYETLVKPENEIIDYNTRWDFKQLLQQQYLVTKSR